MKEISAHKALKTGERVVLRMAAIIVGAIMALAGIGMGVTMFLLPIGVPLGLIGAGIFTWGVFGFRQRGP